MKVGDVTHTLDLALTTSGCDKVRVEHGPRLLSNNGSCYIASDLGEWLDNPTPADVYFGRGQTILLKRDIIKQRRLNRHAKPA